ncbi:MAG: alpha/beta hydrolase [Oscillospiraceae bacterium]|nr:alpha/beta hydrolase [Oscillospiraceae bacterium]
MYHAKENRLKLNNVQMNYITFGKGAKPLVMIQGLNTRSIKGSAAMLSLMYRIFSKEYKVYLFDRRDGITEGVTVRDFAADIAMAMDSLAIANADVFGVSQGGMIAQYLAIDRPDLVHKLVLAVTLSKNNDTVRTVINDWTEMTLRGNYKALALDMAEKMYSDTYIKKYKPFMPLLTVLQKPKDTQRFITLAKACLTCNSYDELDKIKCPVFVIGGQQDKVVGAEGSKQIAEKLGCRIYMYDDLGHAAYEEASDFNKRVYDFFME